MLLQGAPAPYNKPESYAEPSHARLGFLLAPAGQPGKAAHRRHALHNLMNSRWQAAAEEAEAARRAAHCRRRLLAERALAALHAAVAAARAAAVRADLQRQKWIYLRYTAAWEAWRTAVANRRRLSALAAEAAALHRATLLARSLAAFQRHVAARRAKRRADATASSFACFCLLVHALDGWRQAVAARHSQQARLETALLHWAVRLCRGALDAWRAHKRRRQHKRAAAELAASTHRARLLGAALHGWLEAWRRLRDRQSAAAVAIQHALYGSDERLAGMCLEGWRWHAARKAQLREDGHLADRLRRFGLLGAAWRGWQLWLGWQRHLHRVHARVHALEPRLLAALALRRWQAGVVAAQAQDGAACYRAVQLPRLFLAWRQRAQRIQEVRLQAEWCQRLLACRRRRAALLAWRRWAAGRRATQIKVHQMEDRRLFLRQHAVLAAWRGYAQVKALQRDQLQQAGAHCAARVCHLALQRWRRWAGLRHAGGRWRRRRVLQRAFGGWRQRAAAKAQWAERWRMAVRHCYLRLLWSGLEGLRQHHQRRQQKQRRQQAMHRRYQVALLRYCLQAWSGPFLAATRHRRAKQQAAEGMACRLLLTPVIASWRGPFLTAARQRRSRLQAADRHRAARLQHSAWVGWLEWQERREYKRQHVAAAQALLQPGRLRRLLAAWRSWHAKAVLRGCQEATAAAAARKLTLRHAWQAWQAYLHSRRQKHRRWCAALLFAGRQQAQRALCTWRAAANAAAALHKQQASTAPQQVEQDAGASGSAAAAAGAGQAPLTGATAQLLARLRQLRSEAEAAAPAAGAGACSAPGAPETSVPVAMVGAAATVQAAAQAPRMRATAPAPPEWRATSIANLVLAGGARQASGAHPSQAACDSCASHCSATSLSSEGGSAAGWLGWSCGPRPAPRRPCW
ncbi:hypothetical protein ABPG75_000374 [Micractinium tetrahymenae]